MLHTEIYALGKLGKEVYVNFIFQCHGNNTASNVFILPTAYLSKLASRFKERSKGLQVNREMEP